MSEENTQNNEVPMPASPNRDPDSSQREDVGKQKEQTEAPVEEKVEETKTEETKPEEKKEAVKEENKEEVKEEEKKEKKPIDPKFQNIISEIEKMSILELSDLVKSIEDKFGVSAAAPVMVAGGAAAGEEGDAEEKTSFDVELKDAGSQKIQVIKVIREALGIGLKDAKDLSDAAPKVLKEGMAKAEAEELKKKLEGAGATVTLK